MYNCEFCKKVSDPRTPCSLVPVEWQTMEISTADGVKPTRQIKKERRACAACAATASAQRTDGAGV